VLGAVGFNLGDLLVSGGSLVWTVAIEDISIHDERARRKGRRRRKMGHLWVTTTTQASRYQTCAVALGTPYFPG
jgi:phosphoribosylaminoimidazole carboxylase (NCAIR synthetase)